MNESRIRNKINGGEKLNVQVPLTRKHSQAQFVNVWTFSFLPLCGPTFLLMAPQISATVDESAATAYVEGLYRAIGVLFLIVTASLGTVWLWRRTAARHRDRFRLPPQATSKHLRVQVEVDDDEELPEKLWIDLEFVKRSIRSKDTIPKHETWPSPGPDI